MTKHWLVFSDLDGTLLDHHSYSFEPALAALEKIRALTIPLVLNSSKTCPEMQVIRRSLNNTDPYIAENGAVLVIPPQCLGNEAEQCINFAEPLGKVMDCLAALRKAGFLFRSFADISTRELAEITGLPRINAEYAQQRVATQPLLWLGSDVELEVFTQRLEAEGLQLVRGGRFHHVMGQYDKADAMTYLVRLYQSHCPDTQWQTVALGDSPNDIKMLEAADYAVVIKGVNSAKLNLSERNTVIYSAAEGPAGWNETMLTLLSGNV